MSKATSVGTLGEKALAWSAHALTATGTVWGLLALFAAINQQWQMTFVWMIIGVFVDAVDGFYARLVNVKKFTPHFDGALLDNVIDFFTYVLLPGAMVYLHPTLLPSTGWAIFGAGVMGMTSSYQFCRTDAKTVDHTFLGFPSYWNILVVYLILMEPNPWLSLFWIVLCGVLVFIPIKYAYPSRMLRFQTPTLTLAYVWAVVLGIVIYMFPNHPIWLVWVSLVYAVYYVGISLYMMFR